MPPELRAAMVWLGQSKSPAKRRASRANGATGTRERWRTKREEVLASLKAATLAHMARAREREQARIAEAEAQGKMSLRYRKH